MRASGGGVRHAAHADDVPQPRLLRRVARGLRLHQGEGSARVREYDSRDPRAHHPRRQGDRRAQRNPLAAARHEALQAGDRKSTRLNSSHGYISYAVFCLKKKKTNSSPFFFLKKKKKTKNKQ